MSWQLVSFALVVVALALAFWWYERSRPSAKLVAVIATLAALAALGRDAFAAVPDVKPITAIVLVSGVAFGAGPGFAVGAISGFASNILLGEGPWTPWQMLGWGLVGLLGAGLGALSGRRPSRVVLALSCAAAAECFNLVVDVYTWTGAGSHTLAAFLAVLASALAFDMTHVVASFAFALAFGTVLLRMLLRVRARLEVTWNADGAARVQPPVRRGLRALPATSLLLALAVAVPALAVAAGTIKGPDDRGHRALGAAARPARTVDRSVAYVLAAQNRDGGFAGARGQSSAELYSAWAAMGLAAVGRDPRRLRRDGHSVCDALRAGAGELRGAGDIERTMLAVRACGASPHAFPGGDLVARLLRTRGGNGSFAGLTNLTAFAILALRATGRPADGPTIAHARAFMAAQQVADGGFGFAAASANSDVDDTAAVLQALAASGAAHGAVAASALSYLLAVQNADGGFPQMRGGPSNSQSTSWAVQALVAVGHDPRTVRRRGSRTPLQYIESLIAPDGSVRYSRTGAQTPVWVTAQALTALAERPLPIAPVTAQRR